MSESKADAIVKPNKLGKANEAVYRNKQGSFAFIFNSRIWFVLFLALIFSTDVWSLLHAFFPEKVPSYKKTFAETVKLMSSVTVEPYNYSKHHDVNDLKDKMNRRAYNYLKDTYSEGNIPNTTHFEELCEFNFTSKKEEVREAIYHSWSSYRKSAWGFDSIKPVSGRPVNDFSGLSMTLIDSIDTLLLAGFHKEANESKMWILDNFRIETQQNVNIFELNIRVLGGLLSAYQMTGDEDYKIFAEYVASKIVQTFVEPSGVPYCLASYGKKPSLGNNKWTGGCSSTAEIGTLALELEYMGDISGNEQFKKPIRLLNKVLHKLVFTNRDKTLQKSGQADMLRDGLLPSYIDPVSGTFGPCNLHQKYTLGGGVDSVYEYFLKLYIMSGKNNKKLKKQYLSAVDGAVKHLLRVTRGPNKYVYLGERIINKDGGIFMKNMDHLACYVPGMLALGVYHNLTSPEESQMHLDLAKHLMRTCYSSYKTTASGLAPEVMTFSKTLKGETTELSPKSNGKHSLHRPETVESLHLLFAVTGDPIYKLWGLEIFEAIQKHGRVEFGYSGVKNVNKLEKDGFHNDRMESFFISETLKYLFLLFSDEDHFPLDKYVFNTEAHPFPIK